MFVHTMAQDDVPSGTVVALTGHAYVSCVERGLEPTVTDDHIDRRALLLDGRLDDLRWQLTWFDDLSKAGGASPEALQLCRHLLHGPLDAVIANARMLDAVVARTSPSEIVFVGPSGSSGDPWHSGHLYFSTELGDVPVSAVLLRAIAANHGLPFNQIDTGPPPPRSSLRPRRITRAKASARRRLGAAWNLVRPRAPRRGPSSLLLWNVGYGAGRYAAAEASAGFRLLTLRRHEPTTCLLQPSPLGLRRRGPVVSTEVPAPSVANQLPVDDLLAEIDRHCQVAGSGEALRSRIVTYCTRLCPTVERIASVLAPALRGADVQRVAAASPFSLEEFGALLACASLEPTPHRTLAQHGDAAFPYDCWIVRDLHLFDEMACSDPTVPTSMAAPAEALRATLPAFSFSAPRVEDFQRRLRRSRRRAPGAPLTVCYVPTGFQGENNQLCGAGFDDAWYARWQLQLLEAMVERPQVRFIWKAAPVGLQVDPDPLAERVAPAGAEHIRYETAPVRSLIGDVDRVFLDFASTALFEAVHAGLPTLCVSFTANEDLRVEARELLGPCLRSVGDEGEALRAFAQFIEADVPEQWGFANQPRGRFRPAP